MNCELSTEVIKILDDLAKRFGVVIDWASDNVMPYLMELYNRFITYKIVENSLGVLLFLVVLGISILFFSKFIKYYKLGKKNNESNLFIDVTKYTYSDNSYSMSIFSFIGSMSLGIILIAATCMAFHAIDNLLELIFVPELYMVDYLSSYM